jgi:hypothetical protein
VRPGPVTREELRVALADANRVDARARDELARAGFADPTALADAVIASPRDVARITEGARVHTEDDAWVEFGVADHLLRGDGEGTVLDIMSLAPSDRNGYAH